MAGHTNDIHVRHPFDKFKTSCRSLAGNYLNWVNFNYNINSKKILISSIQNDDLHRNGIVGFYMYNDIERVYPHQVYQRACYVNIN